MAIFSQAQDINTRKVIWVAQNVAQGRRQLNSHTSHCYQRAEIDGHEAWDLCTMYTDYVGNDWQAKHLDFIAKWSEVDVAEG